MKKLKLGVIGAGARGARAYAPYVLENPHEAEFVAVAEPIKERREKFANTYGVKEEFQFNSWEDLLAKPKLCDALIIATLDDMHFEPAMKALELGYDLLLEKPMSNNEEECELIAGKAKELNRKVVVCHVLRYTNFCKELKKCLDDGLIGDIVSIQHNENVGFFHQAHSFVRGNWGNKEKSSPMILQKCCHDMDLLNWLIGKKCLRLSSFGSLKYFKKENAPEGSTEYCLDGCSVKETCPYFVMRYWEDRSAHRSFTKTVCNSTEPTPEAFLKEVQKGRYGKCVFRCENNVVDHQVVNMEYEDDITVAFTMSAFTDKMCRTMKIMGTKGELHAHMEENHIKISDFLSGNTIEIHTNSAASGHGGGDFGIMHDFLSILRGEKASDSATFAEVSVDAHTMAFAAEESRLTRKVIELG